MNKYSIFLLSVLLPACSTQRGVFTVAQGEGNLTVALIDDHTYMVKNLFDRRCNCETYGQGTWSDFNGRIILKDKFLNKPVDMDVYQEIADVPQDSFSFNIINLNGFLDQKQVVVWIQGIQNSLEYDAVLKNKIPKADSLVIQYETAGHLIQTKVLYINPNINSIDIVVKKPNFQEYCFLNDTLSRLNRKTLSW